MITTNEKKAVQKAAYQLTQWGNQPSLSVAVVKQMIQRKGTVA